MLGSGWATGQEVVLSDWFEDHGVKPDFSEAAWYGRTFTMPRETAGRRVVVTFTTLNTRAAVYVGRRRRPSSSPAARRTSRPS